MQWLSKLLKPKPAQKTQQKSRKWYRWVCKCCGIKSRAPLCKDCLALCSIAQRRKGILPKAIAYMTEFPWPDYKHPRN